MTSASTSTTVATTAHMTVRKRNGDLEPFNLDKILKAVTRSAKGIPDVDPARVAAKTIGGLFDGVTTQDLDKLSIENAASLIPEHPNYSKLAAALLAELIRKEVAGQGIESFSQSINAARKVGLVNEKTVCLVAMHTRKLDNAINDGNNAKFEYYGLRNFYDNLLLRHPATGKVIETPQQFFMRAALSQSTLATDAVRIYRKMATLDGGFVLPPEAVTIKPELIVDDVDIPFRPLMPGMGQAVAERTILRKDADGKWENWGDVAKRVALGNSLLASTLAHPSDAEYRRLRRHIANGNTLMSGRHLQHGDADRPTRNLDVFCNCSTAAASFIEFYLLLNGSGVGRCYDDDMMLVNFDNAPNIRCLPFSTSSR